MEGQDKKIKKEFFSVLEVLYFATKMASPLFSWGGSLLIKTVTQNWDTNGIPDFLNFLKITG